MTSARKVTVVLSVMTFTALGIWIYRGGLNPARPERDAQFSTAPITRGDITRKVLTTGRLSPFVSVDVSSQISGLVTDVFVDFNSIVQKGDPLAKIDSSTYEQKLRQAEADLTAAEANHRLLELDADRLNTMLQKNMVSQQEYDRSLAQVQQAAAALLARRAAVENARLDLNRCTLVSPITGVVIYKGVEVGKTVVASLSAPTLFAIAQDLKKMRIVVPLNEVDVWQVKPGQDVTFFVEALRGRTFRGKVLQIRNPYTPPENQVGGSSQGGGIATFDCVVEVDNSDLVLRPSVSAIVTIIVAKATDVLTVPNAALRLKLPHIPQPQMAAKPAGAETATLYKLVSTGSQSLPRPIQVQLGVTDGMITEVTGDTQVGDLIVTGVSSGKSASSVR